MSMFKRKRVKKHTRRHTALVCLSVSALLLLLLNVVYGRGQILPLQAARTTEQQLGAWEKPAVLEHRWAEDELARLYLSANERAVFFSYTYPDWTGWGGVGMVLDCTQEARVHLADGTLLPADDLFEGWNPATLEHFSHMAGDYAAIADSISIGETVDVLYHYPQYDALRGYVFGRVDDPAVHELRLLAHDGTVCARIGADELIERDGCRYFLAVCGETAACGHTLALYDASGALLETVGGE